MGIKGMGVLSMFKDILLIIALPYILLGFFLFSVVYALYVLLRYGLTVFSGKLKKSSRIEMV